MLDTDALSEILKGKNARARAQAAAYLGEHRAFTVSTISVLEVVKGFHRLNRAAQLTQFIAGLRSMEVVPLDLDAAIVAGRIYADLERSGQPIGRADPMIAGVAISRGLVLISGNVDHYARISKLGHPLEVENWLR